MFSQGDLMKSENQPGGARNSMGDLEGLGGFDEMDDDDVEIIELDDIFEDNEEGGALDEGELPGFPDMGRELGSNRGDSGSDDDMFKDLALSDDDFSGFGSGEGLEVNILEDEPLGGVGAGFDFGAGMEFSKGAEPAPPADDEILSSQAEIDALMGLTDDEPPKISKAPPRTTSGPALSEDLIEELVSRIEAKLVEAAERIIESRLPDVVRAVLKEEIERLRGEMGID